MALITILIGIFLLLLSIGLLKILSLIYLMITTSTIYLALFCIMTIFITSILVIIDGIFKFIV